MRELLVIGYGNPLRSDDGVGPRVAAALARQKLPGVRTMISHQLTPEMAEPIASAQKVVFIDAAVDSSAVRLRPIRANGCGEPVTHGADPRSLLALAKTLFGRCPAALWLTIPAGTLGFGDRLSPAGRKGARRALELILAMSRGQKTRKSRQFTRRLRQRR